MAVEIILPSMSAGMEDAVIAKWLVGVGDKVTQGQVIAEVETDKATMELEAEADGTVGVLNVQDGKRADVGQVLAILLADGEALPAGGPAESKGAGAKAADATAADAPVAAQAFAPPAGASEEGGRKHLASPIARRMAAAAGLDLTGVLGSGPKGRIVKLDVSRLIAAGPATAAMAAAAPMPTAAAEKPAGQPPQGIGPYTAVPLSNMRRVIARRLVEAKQTVPHFYLGVDCELDALMALRAQINEGRDKAAKISVNDFVIKAAAQALRKVAEANVIWNENEILQLADVDISVAVATEGGLLTPILRSADRMSLGTLSTEMKSLASRARAGKLKPEEYQGGGFSISNLGMYGVKTFSAIINPPQSCILAVGAIDRRPVGRGESIVLADVMNATLSVDHRSVDGALGAQVLAAFKEGIENPMGLLL